jgi:predicted RNA methylase
MPNAFLPGFEHEERRRDLSQFFTPTELAQRIAAFALEPYRSVLTKGTRELHVLEPSCGHGALVKAVEFYAAHHVHLTGVDIDPRNIEVCKSRDWGLGSWAFICADFMRVTLRERYDLSVQNTPFEDNQAATHIMHALKFARRVVAHVPLTTLAGQERREMLWDKVNLHRLATCSKRWSYGHDGGGATDMMTVDVTLREQGAPRVATEMEWWD